MQGPARFLQTGERPPSGWAASPRRPAASSGGGWPRNEGANPARRGAATAACVRRPPGRWRTRAPAPRGATVQRAQPSMSPVMATSSTPARIAPALAQGRGQVVREERAGPDDPTGVVEPGDLAHLGPPAGIVLDPFQRAVDGRDGGAGEPTGCGIGNGSSPPVKVCPGRAPSRAGYGILSPKKCPSLDGGEAVERGVVGGHPARLTAQHQRDQAAQLLRLPESRLLVAVGVVGASATRAWRASRPRSVRPRVGVEARVALKRIRLPKVLPYQAACSAVEALK